MMYHQYQDGWIEVITGCMFAGKSEELIKRINVLTYANKKTIVFKPKIDFRYSMNEVVSHDGSKIKCEIIETSKDIFKFLSGDEDVIAIDEVQFLDDGIIEILNTLANQGKRVIVAGLDMDYQGVPFYVMAQLIAMAEFVTKLTAVCVKCGASATRTYRIIKDSNERILIGASESYEARCRHCHKLNK